MKFKSLFAILLVITLLACTCILPASAKESTNNNDVEIIIYNEVSIEAKQKIENYFATGEPTINHESTYGLTCTLLGHNLESSTVATVTHKVSATSPRCLKRIYDYAACTRCDYETSELVKSSYIACCT